MADKDITGFSEFFDVWLPTRLKDTTEPIISSAENTIDQMNSQVLSSIRSSLVPLIASNHAMNTKVMNSLDDRISISEGKNQAFDNAVLDRLDTHLVPIETNTALSGGKELTVIPGQTALPGGGIEPKPMPGFPSGSINPVQIGPGGLPISGTIINEPIGPPQQIENVPPECPPIGECPPIPPCPEPIPTPWMIWVRSCKIPEQTCAYILPALYPPLDPNDIEAGGILNPNTGLLAAWLQSEHYCEDHIPNCGVPQPIPPGGIIQNVPIPPGCCPPAQIQNIINPPPDGGQIQNIPIPGGGTIINIQPNPIINEPLPISPRPPITGFGQIVNDTVNLIAEKLKWRPTGDFAYITDQDNDESGFTQLWKEIGVSPKQALGGKSLVEWAKEQLDNANGKAKFQRR